MMRATEMRVVMFAIVAGVGVAACEKSSSAPDVDAVTADEAAAFAPTWAAAVMPCSPTKLAAIIDDDAFAARFRAGSHDAAMRGAGAELAREHIVAEVVCSAQEVTQSYTLLRVHVVGGEPRPLFRRITKDERTGVSAVSYDELMLGKSRTDHQVRAIDSFSYIQGDWLSTVLRAVTSATIDSGDASDALAAADKMKRARQDQIDGKFAEALALLDSLPPTVRKARATQLMRVAVAAALSEAAYKEALDEVAATFPDDPSTALVEIDGAFLHKDYDAAMRYIDVVDKAIGGDPWQDALRAEVLIHRGKPGDLDAAAARADAAVKGAPTLAKGWWARLDVALARKQWPVAISVMDELVTRFQVQFADDAIRSSDAYNGLADTPEYAAWHAKHP